MLPLCMLTPKGRITALSLAWLKSMIILKLSLQNNIIQKGLPFRIDPIGLLERSWGRTDSWKSVCSRRNRELSTRQLVLGTLQARVTMPTLVCMITTPIWDRCKICDRSQSFRQLKVWNTHQFTGMTRFSQTKLVDSQMLCRRSRELDQRPPNWTFSRTKTVMQWSSLEIQPSWQHYHRLSNYQDYNLKYCSKVISS